MPAVEAPKRLRTWLYKQLWKETLRKNNQHDETRRMEKQMLKPTQGYEDASFSRGSELVFNLLSRLPKAYIMHCLVTDKENSDAPVQIFCFSLSFRLTIFFLQLFGEAPELFKNALNAVGSSPNIKCSLIIIKKKKKNRNVSVIQAAQQSAATHFFPEV